MMRRVFGIVFCFVLIFATSGNSRGLIFKNLPEIYRAEKHHINHKHHDPGCLVPPNEEIVEDIKFKNYIQIEEVFEIKNDTRDHVVSNWFLLQHPKEDPTRDVISPPPDKL